MTHAEATAPFGATAATPSRRKSLAGRSSPRPPAPTEPSLPLPALALYVGGMLVSGEASMHSATTLSLRRMITDNLLWFLRPEKAECCGLTELRAFFAYIVRGHLDPGGRWGNPQQTRAVRPGTVKTSRATCGPSSTGA